jgi:C4-dicarboxylate transporter DctM subunit
MIGTVLIGLFLFALVAVLVSMLLGGISGSGPADAVAVAAVMLPSMIARGYPKGFSAGLFPGMIAALCLLVPAIVISRKYGFGRDFKAERPPLGKSLIDVGELSAVVLMIIGIASVFAWAGNTLGIFDAAAKALVGLHSSEWLMLLSINLLLLAAGQAGLSVRCGEEPGVY